MILRGMFCIGNVTAILLAVMASASANEVSSQVKSAAFLEAVAERGSDCELLRPWQAASIRALNREDMKNWTTERRHQLPAELNSVLENMDCQHQTMKVWIDGARRGFDAEMLPPYIIVYRALAEMENPPAVFTATTLRLNYKSAIAMIDGKLAELSASGIAAEGGKTWEEYISKIEKFTVGFSAILTSNESSGAEADQAAAWIAQSALITELWLKDEE